MPDGLLVVDKPSGCTSHDVVARVRHTAGTRRVGHAGTLDPSATGVLLLGVGRATRLLRFVTGADKAYRAEVVFGIETDTLDADGRELARAPMELTRAAVEAAAGRLTGELQQVPPMVSAVKIGGRRLHELARRGEEVERAPRAVRVDRFEVVAFTDGPFPIATVEVECGRGTYVRSLAADLGASLGGRAHLRSLRRTRVGPFGLEDAHPLAAVETELAAALLPPLAAVRDLPRVEADAELAGRVLHGAVLPTLGGEHPASAGSRCALIDPAGALLAVYEARAGAWKPSVVLGPAPVGTAG